MEEKFIDRRIETYVKITTLSTFIIILIIFSWLLYSIRGVLFVFALAFLASYIVGYAVRFFERYGFNRFLIVSLLYTVFVLIVVICAMIFLPILWDELISLGSGIENSIKDPEFGKTISANIDYFQERLSEVIPQFRNLNLKSHLDIDNWVSKTIFWILGYLGELIRTITSYSGKVLLITFVIFIIPFITFFLLKDDKVIKQTAKRLIPIRYHAATTELLQTIDRQIGKYIGGKIAEALVLSIITTIGLRILNINYYLIIGSIAGFVNLIPYIGNVFITILAGILAFYQYGVLHAVITIIFLSVLHALDHTVFLPMIVGKSVDLHPLLTIFVVFVGGETLGILGMITAVPLTSILISIFQSAYKEFRNFSIPL